MRKYLKAISEAQNSVMGINRRNIEFIYPNNSRKDYIMADDKALCKTLLDQDGIPVPRTFLVIEHLWDLENKLNDLEELENFVVKPAMGSGGNGILILKKQTGGWTGPDGKTFDRERLKMHLAGILYGAYSNDHADKAILEERLVPHPFFSRIYDRGIPDVRIIVHHHVPVMAMLRIPTRSSKGKANLHQGALGIGIGMETGKLGIGVFRQKRIEAHPDSGFHSRDSIHFLCGDGHVVQRYGGMVDLRETHHVVLARTGGFRDR